MTTLDTSANTGPFEALLRNISMAVASEAGELTALLRWVLNDQADDAFTRSLAVPGRRERMPSTCSIPPVR